MSWRTPRTARRRALFIFPRTPGAVTANDAVFPFPLVGLSQLAAYFEPDFEVRIHDETRAPLRRLPAADLVLVTTLTSTAARAYEIADAYRAAGVPVVLGGVHATMLPEEAAPHADAVVVGEAEPVMERLVADAAAGRLRPVYRAETRPDLDDLPVPAVHLLSRRHRFFMGGIQTSRGCPQRCNFCSVPATFGRRLRVKSLGALDRELAALARVTRRRLFVVDDNFTLARERALAILELFRRHGFRWMGFSNLAVSEDEDFLRALRRSGCLSLFIGFESLHAHALFHKNDRYHDPAEMRRAVARIHAHGIGIQGSFIFGFDGEGPEVFEETAAFIQETGIELPAVNILTPFPGTALFDEMERAGRLLHRDWSRYDMSHVVFEPRGMTPAELQQGYAWTLKYLASPTSILRRLGRRTVDTPYFLVANFALRNAQTRLARRLWNPPVQADLESRGLLCRS
ncbi:B12-binding domain-containing radical SAM protein [Dissulfurirhabdus thermomarina]|uniref:B12-binding domain-containing radical SAM protein n=1 Tax=Dissulfurirhabdus thermomarina TaxID=1765737 RepID=A0A6N9TPM4_DISTH|nr:radical SAM protein [Dissulfurirhabdus thermomarina]NDY43119.1 B12-binding domain-containing radical SAM protein [Dissulfurirhabdus thermomarina]NMX23766.1 B12-binding domain-containing radical SAM protein [Dissulfurirhabdus thermomarina]